MKRGAAEVARVSLALKAPSQVVGDPTGEPAAQFRWRALEGGQRSQVDRRPGEGSVSIMGRGLKESPSMDEPEQV